MLETEAPEFDGPDPIVHSEHSTLRELITEHRFIAQALSMLWRKNIFDVEIMRSEIDAYGYDLVMGRGAVVRHIQLKSGIQSKPKAVSVRRQLWRKPSGCVLWICLDDTTLEFRHFRYYGALMAGGSLPPPAREKITKRTTPDSSLKKPERANYIDITPGQFVKLDTFEQVLEILLGPLIPYPPSPVDELIDGL